MIPRTVTFLVVEDDEVDADSLKRAFKKQRLVNPVVVAKDGIEALKMLRAEDGEWLAKPYLILLDLNMPRMNGIEFLEEIRCDKDLKRSIVFVLTTSADDRDMLAAYDKHVAGYIVKSRIGEDFMDMIRMLDQFSQVIEIPG